MSDIVLFEIAGIIMLAIFIFVHIHTYGTYWKVKVGYTADLDNRVPFPAWLLIVAIIISLIPIINVAGFILGMLFYFIACLNDDISPANLPKWTHSICKYMTKDLNKYL